MPYLLTSFLQTLIFLAAFNFLMTYCDVGLPANNTIKNDHNSVDLPTNKISKSEVISKYSSNNTSYGASNYVNQEVSEGGPVTSLHSGREHVIEAPIPNVTNKSGLTNNITSAKSVQKTVISDIDIPLQHEKPSVPKKGVSFIKADHENDSLNTINNLNHTNVNMPIGTNFKKNQTSEVTVEHKKPLVTESDDDYIDSLKSGSNSSKEKIILNEQPDPILVQKNNKRSDYIVPIVAVILSVPLVAILISVVYKRGTDWWQHRNYKRMDFLIEGMYHN